MYPETDVPSVAINEQTLEGLELPGALQGPDQSALSRLWLELRAGQVMAASPNYQLFEEIVSHIQLSPSLQSGPGDDSNRAGQR